MLTIPVIYFIYHQATNSIYIGECINYKRRNLEEKRALRKKCFHNESLQRLYNTYGSKSFIYGILQYSPPHKPILKNLEKYYIEQFSICCNILNSKKGDYDIKLIKPHLNDPYSRFIKNCFQKVYPSTQSSDIPFESTSITVHRLHQEFLISLVSVLSEKYGDNNVFKTIFEINLDLCNDSLLKLFIYFPNYFILKFIEEYCNSSKLFLKHNTDNRKNYNRSTQRPFFSLNFQEFFTLYQGHSRIHSEFWRNILLTAISDFDNVYLEKFPIPRDFVHFLDLSQKYNLHVASYKHLINNGIAHMQGALSFLQSPSVVRNSINTDIYNNLTKNITSITKALENNSTLFYSKKILPRYRVEQYFNKYFPELESPEYDFSKSIPFDWVPVLDDALDFDKDF